MVVWYLKLKHPLSKRTSIKKFKTKLKYPKAIRRQYYGTAHHYHSEASVIKMSRKKRTLKKKR